MQGQTCVDCHFFTKEMRGPGVEHTFVVSGDERAAVRRDDFSWKEDHWSIGCAMNAWSEGAGFDMSRRRELLTTTDRTGFCFFFRHKPGMLLPAARVLQEREAADAKASRDRLLTVIGLWIAAVALVIDVIGKLLDAWS